jgi:serine/threonine-protein kinase HipA
MFIMVNNMLNYTLQIYFDYAWHDAVTIKVHPTDHSVEQITAYRLEYAVEHLSEIGASACSVNCPVELAETFRQRPWFGYLDDILPAGASRRWWVKQLGIVDLPLYEQKLALLKYAVIAPVGNLRIKECVDTVPTNIKQIYFSLEDVTRNNREFLTYAQQRGAASGGATGAGGEAPKLLLAKNSDNRIWIDTLQAQSVAGCINYLVKFPRGKSTDIDKDILRAEYHFYHELHAMEADTIDIGNMFLVESDEGPSLWLPRFDIESHHGQRVQYGLESIYSMMKKAEGALRHQDVFACLSKVLHCETKEARNALATEYVWRDLLNIVFSNTDNHGRNMSIIKKGVDVRLAPIYDFAPMKFDPEVVTRSTTWGQPYEVGGEYDFPNILASLDGIDPIVVLNALKKKAINLLGLYERLSARGVPKSILDAPSAWYNMIDKKLHEWGVM